MARRHDFSPSQLFGWLKQFRNEAQALLETKCPPERPVFAPAVVDTTPIAPHALRKCERLSEDQLNLALEDLETAIASGQSQRTPDAHAASAPPQSPREGTIRKQLVKPCCFIVTPAPI